MSLRRLLAEVRGREKTLTVYAPRDAGVVDAVREYFASQHVAIEHEQTEGDLRAVLSDDGEELAAVGADALRELASRDLHDVGDGAPYSPLLAPLDGTTFTSYDRRQMAMASREIEDRAWRANGGQLHSGFQRLSNVDGVRDTYEQLAASDLDVHVYGVADVSLGEPGFSVHARDSDELASTWFVLFDGGGDREQSSALLAEERGDDGFYGFWTYDPALVERALRALDGYRQPA
jgi:DICT domain-containing protein